MKFEFLKKVLSEIKPIEKEESMVEDTTNRVLERINVPSAVAVLGGSGAKGTWLKGTHDIDVYVKFDYGLYRDKTTELSDVLEPILKKIFRKVERLHGSRDYFQIRENSYIFEIIPILDIKTASEAKNITDVSLLHVQFVKNAIDKNKKLGDEIRLAKAFTKANNCYGAESYIMGFSGYMMELLIIHYGSFLKLIKEAGRWKAREAIGDHSAIKGLNAAKRQSQLIFIDPVQPGRNTAAALSKEKYNLFIKICKEFLKKPSHKFFETKKLSIEELKRKYKNYEIISLTVKSKTGKDDVVGAKIRKTFEFIKEQLINEGFKLIDSAWEFKPANFFFVVDKKSLEKQIKYYGPPLHLKKHVDAFKKKYKKTFEEKGRICALIQRSFTRVKPFLINLIKNRYVKERVADIKLR